MKTEKKAEFFSVLIPTRNRPEAAIKTIRSLKRFHDEKCEIIVSDNSCKLDSTSGSELLENVCKDEAVNYIRPPSQMSMADHWNWALGFCGGHYISVVTDRMTLCPHTLEIVKTILDARPDYKCISYGFSENPYEVMLTEGIGQIHCMKIASDEALRNFRQGDASIKTPRLLNCFVAKEVLQRIFSETGRFVGGIAPDYNFFFSYCMIERQFLHLDVPLLYDHSPSVSNGRAIGRGKRNVATIDFVKSIEQGFRNIANELEIKGQPTLFHNFLDLDLKIVLAQHNDAHFDGVSPAGLVKSARRQLSKHGVLWDRWFLAAFYAVEVYALRTPQVPMRIRSTISVLQSALRNSITELRKFLRAEAAINEDTDYDSLMINLRLLDGLLAETKLVLESNDPALREVYDYSYRKKSVRVDT